MQPTETDIKKAKQISLLACLLAVYTGLMTTGVLLGYLLLNRTLGIFRKDPVAP